MESVPIAVLTIVILTALLLAVGVWVRAMRRGTRWAESAKPTSEEQDGWVWLPRFWHR